MSGSLDPNLQKELLNALEGSGFPFQTGVAQTIRDTNLWQIDAEEFPWRDPLGGDQFVDIICSHGAMTAVVECKKTTKRSSSSFSNPGRRV